MIDLHDPPVPHLLISQIGFLRTRILKECDKIFRDLDFPLEMDQIPVLVILYYSGSISQQDICFKLHRDKASINRTVTLLANKGIARVVADSTDKRKTRVELTALGKKLSAQADTEFQKFGSFLSSGLSPDELQLFHSLMQKLIDTITST